MPHSFNKRFGGRLDTFARKLAQVNTPLPLDQAARRGRLCAMRMSDAPALEIQSGVNQVYRAVRGAIVAGELPRGARLRQAQLASQLGVSRTPLREALRRLATEGLVVLEPNRGATVVSDDPADMRDAWLARLALEPGAARLAAERRDAAAVERMRHAIGEQRRTAGDLAASFDANRDFHLALVGGAGNSHLSRFAEMLWVPRIGVAILGGQSEDPRRVIAWADEHEQIAAAVAAGEADRAERLTRAHIAAAPPVTAVEQA
jgi:DNA-binding GntR family transcriptional regulator